MSHRRTPKPSTPRIVDSGDGWRIEFSPADRDYAAIVEGAGLLGYEKTETAARTLIANCRTSALLHLEAVAGDVGGVVAYVNGHLTIVNV